MVTDVALRSQKTLFQSVAEFLIRYGLAIVLGWIGAMKFTTYEANRSARSQFASDELDV